MTFGRSMLPLWPLDPAATYLNHGTVGVTPRQVLDVQQRWRDRMERHPAKFMLRELWTFTGSAIGGVTLMRQAAADVAAFVGARSDDLVFVDNTTAGINAVVQSLPFQADDEIVMTDHAYGGIVTAVRHAAARAGAKVVVVEMPYPAFDPALAVTRVTDALTARTRLVIVDHISAQTALVFPIEAIVGACHDHGAPVLVDGAHAPGALELSIGKIGAEFYVANLHKWAMAPRSSAILVVAPAFQATVHPAVISWGYQTGFTQEFDWIGTRDPTPWLSAPDGIRFLQGLGFEDLRRHNHALAWQAARYLTDCWQTPLPIDEAAVGCMVSVVTPASCGATQADAVRLRDRLLFEHDIEVQVHARGNRVWVRVSAQVYNDTADIERLGAAVRAAALRAG
jgi:isopenicillin-N epimerase